MCFNDSFASFLYNNPLSSDYLSRNLLQDKIEIKNQSVTKN